MSGDSSLAGLQSAFQDYLLGRSDTFTGAVAAGENSDAVARLAIYTEAYNLRLVEALDANFDALHTILGDEQFDAMGRAYIASHPSMRPSIRWFGDQLPAFLAVTEPWSRAPYLAELAAFEWALSLSFDAADATPAALETMAAIEPAAWPGLGFEFVPSCVRLNFLYDVTALRKATDDGAEPVLPPARGDYPVGWVVWRDGLVSRYRSLEVDEAVTLDQAIAGASFASLCDGLCEWMDPGNAAARAASLLKTWLSDGLIAEIQNSG